MKKTLILLALALPLLALAAWWFFLRGGKPQHEFRFDQVSTGELSVNVTATGTINAVTTVEVGTQVSGAIAQLFADFNSVVRAGQVVAQIDPTFLQQSVKEAEASLQRAQAQVEESKRVMERTRALLEKHLESQESYDAALTGVETNQAALKQTQAALDRARINLSYATIRAPIDGVVIDRKVNVGQTVAASLSSPTLYTIANDLRKMQVETTVDESDIGKVSIGQSATFTVDAYPEEPFRGTVSQIRLAPVNIQNVINYTVIIAVNNEQLMLMPGMTANVKIMVAHRDSVLRVPNMALRFQPPGELVDSTKVAAAQPGPPGAGEAPPEGQPERRGSPSARRPAPPDSAGAALPAAIPGEAAPYGVTRTFPEYQKSAYAPAREAGRGRIWILNDGGRLEPVAVRTGLSDGRYTEITGTELQPGLDIVVGISANGQGPEAVRNPLTGQGQSPMRRRF